MGSRAELRGRDLSGKIALLYVRCWEGVLMHSGHLAAARIAKLTDAAGIILWLDLPGNTKYAAQLWGMEGPMTDVPWVNIGFQDGLYLRKLIEHSDPEKPTVVNLTVTGTRTSDGTSQNLIAKLPGTTDETIIITAHIDGFFHASLDNGCGVAALMALAKFYSGIPKDQRERNLVFLVTGHHETTGMSGSSHFAKNHTDILEKTALILQLEHMVSPLVTKELNILTTGNTETPRKLFISNQSPALIKHFKDATREYGIVMDKSVMAAYAADVEGFYGTGVPAAGWLEAGYFYHSEDETPDMISAQAYENIIKANAFVIDRVNTQTREQLEAGQKDTPPIIYDSEDILFLMSMW
jgi:Zn-dependent M28 family amino/carboxypeptidase